MFPRQFGGRRLDCYRRVVASDKTLFSELSHRPQVNLSREFYERVKNVLDRSRLNRIISHNPKCKGHWIVEIGCKQPEGAVDYSAIIYTRITRRP